MFWTTRAKAKTTQESKGAVDVGGRAAVTAGKNMDGFIDLVTAVVVANGLPEESVFSSRRPSGLSRHTVLPVYYRPVKDWDLLVIHDSRLVAAFEFKSQVGPSFGNNFNNRCEEAIGMGEDLRVALREGLLGSPIRPYVGYLMLLELAEKSSRPVTNRSKHFTPDSVFEQASYAARYDVFCKRLMAEQLYDAATLLLSDSNQGVNEGQYSEMSYPTGLRHMVTGLAGRIAAVAV
ncbi:MAG: PaeR7I family type II restriction endonuclease [Bacteroidota bacterium]